MFSPERSGAMPDSREVKQRITRKLVSSLRALQIRYVATDDVITSEDDDANGLCAALEAVFIHGLKSKYIKLPTERRRGKSRHVPLPQPTFWTLLKAATHRNVIGQLEGLTYISTEVGRCRSWLRLALNDCLMESYFLTLRREKNRLQEYYQHFALLLDAEDCEVVLSYLQGLSSLTFDLSYKSSILNEWTASPLALAGLWQDEVDRGVTNDPQRRKSLDSVSQSSGSDDTSNSMISRSRRKPNSVSPLSLDSGSASSQLSSSMGSDETSRGSVATHFPPLLTHNGEACRLSKSPAGSRNVDASTESDTVTSLSMDFSGSDPPSADPAESSLSMDSPASEGHCGGPAESSLSMESLVSEPDSADPGESSLSMDSPVSESLSTDPESSLHTDSPGSEPHCAGEAELPPSRTSQISHQGVMTDSKNLRECETTTGQSGFRTAPSSRGILTANPIPLPESSATAELPVSSWCDESRSWISEEDFSSVEADVCVGEAEPGEFLDLGQPNGQSPPGRNFHVVHRRQIGLSNPFRGLVLLGPLERRNALGLYKSYHCELTPYELRMRLDGDEQSCAETCSLMRCDLIGPAHSDGRFELQFHNKRLYLRASSRDEAQDWVDRINEAVQKFRPQKDETWEILHFPDSPQNSEERKVWAPCRDPSSPGGPPVSEVFDWALPLEVESDALKESVVYVRLHKKWTRFVLSLSERALKCFLLRNAEKSLYSVYGIESVRDILPDASLGSPSCFRLVTTKGSLQLQAESAEEAKAWRELVRAACLEYEEPAFPPTSGNFQIKASIREHLLFPYLLRIPSERGLDAQNFKCAGCHKQIGLQFGKVKLCGYSGLYYCALCHQDERAIIPSRIIHNWDLAERLVSRQALNFLRALQSEPIFNLKYLNESLYQHTERMCAIGRDREKLRLLGEYLMTCRSPALQELTSSLDGRRYLLECAHTYSLQDLRQITEGEFGSVLQGAVEAASLHVLRCDLCSQRGFICPVCNGDDIIYPFQFDTTTRCGECKAVFHIPCKARISQCLRCDRRRRRYQDQPVSAL